MEVFFCSGNGGSSAIWTLWFLNHYSSRSQKFLNVVNLTEYILSLSVSASLPPPSPFLSPLHWRRSDSYLAFSPSDDLQTKTVLQLSTLISFWWLKITLLSQINWVPAPVLALGSWWILSFNEAQFIYFPQVLSFIINLKLFWVPRDHKVAQECHALFLNLLKIYKQ